MDQQLVDLVWGLVWSGVSIYEFDQFVDPVVRANLSIHFDNLFSDPLFRFNCPVLRAIFSTCFVEPFLSILFVNPIC